MLTIIIPEADYFDEVDEVFIKKEAVTLSLEHSLVSLSKWESKWEKPFLGPADKTLEETLAYVKDMCLDEEVSTETLNRLTNANIEAINTYIGAKMSATWFAETKAPGRPEIITSEVIYYWMVALSIPFECQHWHLSRLFTLVKVCNEKNNPEKKKMSQRDLAARNRDLNAQRKAQLKTSG